MCFYYGLINDLHIFHSDAGLRLLIAGHTDSKGAAGYNRALSRRRAQSAVDWLRAQGIDKTRVKARGFGERSPVAGNKTAEGRAQNRRVEVRLLEGK